MTQTERVLQLLRARGAHGLTAVDFAAPAVADAGKPIMRVAARIYELRIAGYEIENVGVRNECDVYVLVGEPDPQTNIFDLIAVAA